MTNFFVYLSITSVMLLVHPSIKEVSEQDYKLRFENYDPEFSLSCASEEGDFLTNMLLDYDSEEEVMTCNCPDGAYLKIKSQIEPPSLQEELKNINVKAVKEFMEMHDIKPTKFFVYSHNYQVELIFQTVNASGVVQYWQYENKN